MNRGVYAASSGMVASQQWLDAISQDLANVETNGYKRLGLSFGEALERELVCSSGSRLGSFGPGPAAQGRFLIWERGQIVATGNDLDVAVNQERGMFAIQAPEGIRYARDGAFKLNELRQIVSKGGYPVLDADARPITLPEGAKLEIEENGDVAVDGQIAGRIALFDGNFLPAGSNLYRVDGAAEAVEGASFAPRSLEKSNVNPIEAMIAMIRIHRQFDLSQRTISAEDEASQRLIQSLQA